MIAKLDKALVVQIWFDDRLGRHDDRLRRHRHRLGREARRHWLGRHWLGVQIVKWDVDGGGGFA
ncbi:MAG: hypothetical protein H0T46_07260 [Deltaproteobacteria bacterium]|nr:hypothetical protein [Deltaproteobacteria bacterium]